jgi:glutamate synthase domain-containing protein 3
MTGGRVVVLGKTGRNFAAGMSGGIAYVLDEEGSFASRCNKSMVDLEPLVESHDIDTIRLLVENHFRYTGSRPAERVLNHWNKLIQKFVKVMPIDYRRVLVQMEQERRKAVLAEQPVASVKS